VHSWYGVDAIWHGAGVIPQSHSTWSVHTVQCTVVIHLADFLKNSTNLKSVTYGARSAIAANKQISKECEWAKLTVLEVVCFGSTPTPSPISKLDPYRDYYCKIW
jgi:hypothetical protein